ncbi:MAG: Unknown protein [uncultured Sulfurovum sp.]|uniref:Uncharacterized protein n=1 Tax=uncultured Sulfurovum sp. TaxID=269237 RepID=A0A6S6RY18_9BACT|nr:MAG: Unknown protein [uncultured Sulfurovum sp.]
MKIVILIAIVCLNFLNAEISLISSKECKLKSISKSEVKKLFLLKKKFLNKEKIRVVDASNKALYNQFVKEYLNKSVRKIKTYWTRMLFTGKKIPPKKLSLHELKSLANHGVCHLTYVNKKDNKFKDWKTLTLQ